MSTLPPRQQLAQLVSSMRRRLAGQLDGLLDHPRFATGREALARLDDDTLANALAAMPPEEAGAIARTLLERWAAVAEVELEPHAAIVHPEEVWIGARPVAVTVSVEVGDGLTVDGVAWDGATAAADPRTATILVQPPSDRAGDITVRAHIRARGASGRCALAATARITVRQPRITLGDDRRRIVATDHTGRPAVGVELAVGALTAVTGPGGLVELDAPAPPGARITLAGVPVGGAG